MALRIEDRGWRMEDSHPDTYEKSSSNREPRTENRGSPAHPLTRSPLLPVLLVLLLLLTPFAPSAHAQTPNGALDAGNSDVVLIIDNSGSMRDNDPTYLRLAAAKLFIDLSDLGDKVGIVVMSDKGRTRVLSRGMVRIRQREQVDELKRAIDGLRNEPMGEETHMGTALAQSYDLLDTTPGNEISSANQRQFIVMLSDGLPTGAGQREQVAGAAARFQARRFWKVFSIALGAEADPDYLRQAVAGPSGGEVVVAGQAGDLINSYLEIYTRAGDDRYIDRITVEPNGLTPLVDIQTDQQPTHLSVVIARQNPDTRISSLLAPDDADVVQPFYQNTVRRGAEPEYEVYVVPPEAQVGLVGRWMINVEQPEFAPQEVVVLSRSRLRIRMPAPPPLLGAEDGSIRYHPAGRPLLLTAGAEVAERNIDGPANQPFVYRWVTGMAPVVREIAPGEGQAVALTDDGRAYDEAAEDGAYTGLYPAFPAEGDYTLRLEMPRQAEAPIHIYKDYVIRVAALPTMTLTLPPAATTLPIHTPFTGLIDLPGRADFQVERVTFPTAFVERPDGALDPLTVAPDSEGRYRFEYTPNFAGPYRVSVVAEVQGRGPMGTVRYIDYAEAGAAAPEAVPIVAVSAAFTETLVYDRSGALNVPLRIDSQSPRQEELHIQIEGLPGGAVVPELIVLEPNEAVQRTIAVRLPEQERPEQGDLKLVFSSPAQSVIVQGSQLGVPFQAPGGGLLIPALALLVLGGGGFYWYRRRKRRQQVRRMLAPSAPRRLT